MTPSQDTFSTEHLWATASVMKTDETHSVLKMNTTFVLLKLQTVETSLRSSSQEVFCKQCVLRNFAKFTGKHLHQSLFFNKVAGLRNQRTRDSDTGVFLSILRKF